MPVGDSITYGSSTVGGYRLPLYGMLTNAGFNVDMVGTQTGNSTGMGEPEHEGHGGWQIHQIDAIIAGVYDQIADPDLVLVLIGTNDFGRTNDTANAIARLDALITKMATNRPFAKIVVANLLMRGEPYNTWIQNEFNPFVPGVVSTQAIAGREVYFTDLRADLTLADTYDNLHPNATGYAKMATNWFGVATNLFSPFGSTNAPALARVVGLGPTGVRLTYSKPVDPATATNAANYGLSGGLSVLSATFDAATQRDVMLATDPQASDTPYTLTVSNVTDQTAAAAAIAPGASADFMSSPARGVYNNIPEASDYALVYSLDIPNQPVYSGAAAYTVDLHDYVSNDFTRVAYYMELQTATGPLQYIWAEVDAFTNVASAIGVPTVASGAVFQQPVTNLTVLSSVASIVEGTNMTGGNIEFWPGNYQSSNALGVANASDALYDWGDIRTSGNYGSMQLHNHDASQTLFAFNHWGGSVGTSYADVGIGNGGANPDWTFASNANQFVVKTLQVFALPADNTAAPALAGAQGQAGWSNVVLRFTEPLDDDATNTAHYALDGGLAVLAADLDPVTKAVVTLTTSPQAVATYYTATVNGVKDRTSLHVEIAANSQATFMSAADRGVFRNVPEAAAYTLVYSLDLPNAANYFADLFYDLDLHERTPAFDRVAYYLELQKPGEPVQFMWTSMDAFTNAAVAIGVPTVRSGAVFQQPVTNLNVYSSVGGIAPATNGSGGNLEFWPTSYNGTNAAAVPNATDARFDWGDTRTPGNYGSMQVHDHDAGQVLFAFNRWGGTGGNADLGIGNGTGAEPDWTFMQNAAGYSVKRLQVLARPVANVPPDVAGCASQPGYTSVVVNVTKPLADDATNVSHYAIAGLTVLSAELDAAGKQSVTLTTTAQAPGTRYTVAFSGLRDRTPAALEMAAGTTADFVTTAPAQLGVYNNVPAAAGYTMIYSIDLPLAAAWNTTGVVYDVDHHTGVGAFDRVAYYLELARDGVSTNFLWVEMDPFTADAGQLGIPAREAAAVFQQPVSNLTVYSSAAGVTPGDFAAGNIEFWPNDYSQPNAGSVLNASSANYDWGDQMSAAGNFGSMQVHNAEQKQVLFALNNFGNGAGGNNLCLGIGNYTTNAVNTDWTHIKNAAEFSVRTLQVFVRPAPDTAAPAVASAVLSLDGSTIVVRFSEPVADAAADVANFSLTGGYTILSAAMGADLREVILTIDPPNPGAACTLTVNTVRDRSPNANPIAPGTTAAVTAAVPPAHIAANVPEASAYRLVYQLNLPVVNAGLSRAGTTYDVDNRAGVGAFDRVAYYLELAAPGGPTNWVYASMDAFTADPGRIGVPDLPSGASFLQVVTNMSVYSSDPNIVSGAGIATGNIEFHPWNYNKTTYAGVPTGSGTAYDWNDSTNNLIWAGEGHGSMQVHNHGAGGTGQVIFAYNNWARWQSAATADLGIGNRPGSVDVDWTSAANGTTYLVKNLYVLVRPATDTAAPTIAQALPSMNRTNLLVRFSEPVTPASAHPTNFTLSGGATVQAATLKPTLRDILLTTSAQAPATGYTLTVNNVQDRSTNANVIAANTTANFTTPADAPVFGRVAETANYELLYHLPLPTTAPNYNVNGVSYAVDQRPLIDGDVDRFAYYMELAATVGGTTNWVYASCDAFTPRLERAGIPALGTGAGFQQKVTNMNVRSSLASIVAGDGIQTGNIEFWPWNYNGNTTTVIPTGGGGSAFDWNDTYAVGTGQHGCMQMHNHGANATGQVLFAVNKIGAGQSGNMTVGLGTQPATANMDWTFNYNAGSYAVKNLYVLVRRATPPAPAATPPSWVAHPLSKTGQLGGAVTLAASAVGDAPLSYQWRHAGTPVPGGTNAWLDLAGLQLSDAGSYDVIAANAAGSETSLVATLTVNRPPTMSGVAAGTPKDQALVLESAKLLLYASDPDGDPLAVTGAGPASAQGGTAVAGMAAVTYTPPAGFVGTDSFGVVVSDGRGGAVTATVTVTVTSGEAPSMNIVFGPVITAGQFNVRFAGVPGYTYTIESSDTLINPVWTPVTNMIAPATDQGYGVGILNFMEPTGVASQRFYRTVSPP